jgi:SRSO17 transposase
MDAQTILEIKPRLTTYLHEFDGCFANVGSQRHLATYVAGQLSDLQRKSIEPMADAAGVPPRTLQEFLSLARWDEAAARQRLQRRVARRHSHPHSIGVIDETSFVKKGNQTACVQRQHCGAVGKTENCVVSVHLGYAVGDFHTLLDGEPYLPEETWHNNRPRCRAAGIPDEVVYRSKWQMALEQYRRAVSHGVRFAWLTFDEGYGGKPPFLRELDGCGQNYVAEIPVSFVGWTVPPAVLQRALPRDRRRGCPRKFPRLKVKHTPACEVRDLLKYSPIVRRVAWVAYHVKDGEKGPMVWEAKCVPFWIKDQNGLPVGPYHLLIARSALDPTAVKFFLSNAPASTAVEVLLLVAFSRWRIERMFEDSQGQLGLDHFEVRRYGSLCRHLLLTCVSYLFLAEFCQRQKKRSATDGVPGADGDADVGGHLVWGRTVLAEAGRTDRGAIGVNAGAERGRASQSPQADNTTIARPRLQAERIDQMSLAQEVAL